MAGRRIEIKPTGTHRDRKCQAELIDADGAHLMSIPARYEGEGTSESPYYVVLDIDAVESDLWIQPYREPTPLAVEAVLVAADRLSEAYTAMLEGRDVGSLPDWQPSS